MADYLKKRSMHFVVVFTLVLLAMFAGCQPGPCLGVIGVSVLIAFFIAALFAWIPLVGPIISIIVFIGMMAHACSSGSPAREYCGCSAACASEMPAAVESSAQSNFINQ